jgi:hypothetical protein
MVIPPTQAMLVVVGDKAVSDWDTEVFHGDERSRAGGKVATPLRRAADAGAAKGAGHADADADADADANADADADADADDGGNVQEPYNLGGIDTCIQLHGGETGCFSVVVDVRMLHAALSVGLLFFHLPFFQQIYVFDLTPTNLFDQLN